MSRIAKITTVVLVCGITLSAAAYFLRDTAVAGVVMQKVNTYRINQGLVGWWTFDGTDVNFQTNRVTDRSGQGNTGEMVSMSTSTSRVPGKVGQALQFDGVDDEITLPTASLNLTGAVSVSAWIKSSDVPDWYRTIMRKGGVNTGASGEQYFLGTMVTGNITFHVSNGSNFLEATGVVPQKNEWYHLVGVYDGSSLASLYVNGNLGGSDSSVGFGSLNNLGSTNGAGIGKNISDDQWLGIIDDVRIYNRALSASEVKLLYTSTAGSKMNTSKNVIPGSTLQTGLVGLWSFDGPDVTDKVYDRSGQGNNGYFIGGATNTAKVSGKVGQAMQFGYNNGNNVYIGTPGSLNNLTTKTICAWIKPNSYGTSANDAVIVSKWVGAANGTWSFLLGDDNGGTKALYYVEDFTPNDGAWRSPSNSITLGEWQHVCVAYDKSSTSNDPIFYVNGTPQTTTEFFTPSGSSNNDAFNNFIIGNAEVSGTLSSFDGSLDDVRVYNRALSAQEVKDLYTATAGTKVNHSQNTIPGSTLQNGLVGLWSFSGNDVTDRVYDTSGNGNNGYFEGNATNSAKTSGKSGQGMHFDGVDDFVDLGSPGSLDLAGAASFGAWVNLDDVMGDSSFGQYILAQGCGAVLRQFSLNVGGTAMGRGGAGKVHVFWPDANLHNLSIATLQPGQWYHLFSTRGGTSGNWTSRLYVNGVLDDETTGIATDPGVQCPTSIGRPGDYPYFYTHGKIDGVRLYNRELSASEVKLLYDSGQ